MTLYYASLVSTDVFREFNHSAIIGTLARLDGGVQLKATATSDVFKTKLSCLPNDDWSCLNARDVGPCLPAGDAFFIDFQPDGSYFSGWSPNAIRMEILYKVRSVSYKRIYEFVNVFRCNAWIERQGVYQLGPRHGLIIRHEVLPNVGDWIRPWV